MSTSPGDAACSGVVTRPNVQPPSSCWCARTSAAVFASSAGGAPPRLTASAPKIAPFMLGVP